MSGEHADHGPGTYVKIYFLLLGMLVISILGPEVAKFMPSGLGKAVTIFTAFGIAIVKALMVCAYFMHLNIEKRYIWYMLYTMLAFVGLFFAGVATDVMSPKGLLWENSAAIELIESHSTTDNGDGHDEPH